MTVVERDSRHEEHEPTGSPEEPRFAEPVVRRWPGWFRVVIIVGTTAALWLILWTIL